MSPIPLGILAASGGAPPVAAGAYDLLETTILSSSTSSVSFTNLVATYESTYKHLQIRTVGRTDASAGIRAVSIRINGDTGNNYVAHRLFGDGSTVESNAFTGNNFALIAYFTGATSPSNAFGANVLDFLNPFSTSKNTTIRSLGGLTSNNAVHLSSGLHTSTSAVNEIQVFATANFVSGTRISLYGIRAA